jgi:hypothetical protein
LLKKMNEFPLRAALTIKSRANSAVWGESVDFKQYFSFETLRGGRHCRCNLQHLSNIATPVRRTLYAMAFISPVFAASDTIRPTHHDRSQILCRRQRATHTPKRAFAASPQAFD